MTVRQKCITLAPVMFTKIITFLLTNGGYTEDSLAEKLGRSQSTVNRIKSGQMPRWDDGQRLIAMQKRARRAAAGK